MHLFKIKYYQQILPACQECCSCCLCKACSSFGQRRGNERAITGARGELFLTCSFCKYTTRGRVNKRIHRFLSQFLKDASRTKHCRLELTCGQNLSRAFLTVFASITEKPSLIKCSVYDQKFLWGVGFGDGLRVNSEDV